MKTPAAWQQPINAEAKKQLSKLFNQDAFNQIFKGKDHEQSKQSSNGNERFFLKTDSATKTHRATG
jgi:hypothetical protein